MAEVEATKSPQEILKQMSGQDRQGIREEVWDKKDEWLGNGYSWKKDIEKNEHHFPPFMKSLFERLLPQNPEAIVSLAVAAAGWETVDGVIMFDRHVAGKVQGEVIQLINQAAKEKGKDPQKWLNAESLESEPEGISLFSLARQVMAGYVSHLEQNGWETEGVMDERDRRRLFNAEETARKADESVNRLVEAAKEPGKKQSEELQKAWGLLQQGKSIEEVIKELNIDTTSSWGTVLELVAARVSTEKAAKEKLEAAVAKLPLVDRMAVGLGTAREFSVVLEGMDIQPIIEGMLPVAGFTRLIAGLKFSAHSEKTNEADQLKINVGLGMMKEKKRRTKLEGITFSFTLGNGNTKLTRCGEWQFSNELPMALKVLAESLNLEKEINTRTAFFQDNLNEWLVSEMYKRGVKINAEDILARIANGRLELTVKTKAKAK